MRSLVFGLDAVESGELLGFFEGGLKGCGGGGAVEKEKKKRCCVCVVRNEIVWCKNSI